MTGATSTVADEPRDLGGSVRAVVERVTSLDTVLAVSLILLMLYGAKQWYVRVPTTMLCVGGLVWRDVAMRRVFWLAATSIVAAGVFVNWYSSDNHKYLMVYWCGAIYYALGARLPARTLATSARWLIGLVFLFATGWKIASQDFADGRFLEYTMLTDPRFAGFTELVADVSLATLEMNRDAIGSLLHWDSPVMEAPLAGAEQVRPIAVAMTWWTIVVEGWIAAAFLAPTRSLLGHTRDVALIVFLVSTYAVATVAGFAYLLIAMGLLQSSRTSRWVPLGYVAALFLIQIYTMPLGKIAAQLMSLGGFLS